MMMLERHDLIGRSWSRGKSGRYLVSEWYRTLELKVSWFLNYERMGARRALQ